jgi:predicted transcriptional regulator
MVVGKGGEKLSESFSQLTNEIFYLKDENNDDKKIEQGSIINTIQDDKVIIILHELYVNSSFRRTYNLNLDFFIEQCGYQVNQKSKKNFEQVLNKLKDNKLINFDSINNKIISIDIEPLILKSSKNYFILTDEEINTFKNVKDLRLRITLLKVYTYLKATTTKRSINEKTGEKYNIQVIGVPQVTWQSYEYIEKFINIGQAHLKTYIDKLKELGLIDYASCGKKYHSKDKYKKLSECPNVYTITNLNECGNEQELELGLKQCKNWLEEENGWIVTKTNYKNNDRKTNGKIGGLTKKLNKGTITDKQKEELDKLKQEYKKENLYEATL